VEPGIKIFLKRISTSIGMCVIWLAINTTIGIKYGYAFFTDKIHLSNILFYIWMIVSLAALILFYIKLWEKPIEHLDD
jgi:hypothetical protein